MISYTYVMDTQPHITALKAEVENKKVLIRDVWGSLARVEGQADMGVLLSLADVEDKDSLKALKEHYLKRLPGLDHTSNAQAIIAALEKQSQEKVDYINQLYLQQTQLQENVSNMERKAKFYADLAFFMQILSLILILLRKDFLI